MEKETAHRTIYGYEYKGKTIAKKTYWADRGIYYWCVGKETFNTLKEAKAYIDKLPRNSTRAGR